MTTTSTLRTIPVHGGLSAPVQRIVAATEAARWKTLPRIEVNETDRTTLQRIADGTLSPLVGPMNASDVKSVLERGAIERAGKRYAWTIPIVLPITDAEAKLAGPEQELALVCDGQIFGKLKSDGVHGWNRQEFVRAIYGTERTDHPGARLWLSEQREKLVGGEIELVQLADTRPFAGRVMGPRETRALVAKKGYEQTVAFQTRNPLHRAHEYALVYGAEKLLKETGKKTGVILNPLVGQLKGDDVPAATRMLTYEALVSGRFLGQGDMDESLWKQHGQNLNDQLELIGLDMRMYYGGPREAVMHAIYRQNLGFSHFIVGRKHADAPYDDKTPIWGDFDAQEIFKKLGGELAIRTVNVGFAAYFAEIGRVGLVEDNAGKTQVTISGTKMRETLDKGELPDERVMRPSTAKLLSEYYRSIGKNVS